MRSTGAVSYTHLDVYKRQILTYTLLHALLYFFTPKKLVEVHGHDNKAYNIMRRVLFWIFRSQKTIIVISILVVIFSIIGVYKIRVNNILLEDLSDKVRIKQDFLFFDKHYSGVRPLELSIEIKNKDKTVWDYDIMDQLNGPVSYTRLDVYKRQVWHWPLHRLRSKSMHKCISRRSQSQAHSAL